MRPPAPACVPPSLLPACPLPYLYSSPTPYLCAHCLRCGGLLGHGDNVQLILRGRGGENTMILRSVSISREAQAGAPACTDQMCHWDSLSDGHTVQQCDVAAVQCDKPSDRAASYSTAAGPHLCRSCMCILIQRFTHAAGSHSCIRDIHIQWFTHACSHMYRSHLCDRYMHR